ncbi:hypothetical protein L083_7372 [Actinoplanes sp. N902-109]|nr:hypothetical protein L083_7372 [Actinoplanes sp. N902-109]
MPWTEEEFLALGETPERIELINGALTLTPAPLIRHQQISRRLANAIEAAIPERLQVYEAINVRLETGRIFIPDIAITELVDEDGLVVDAGSVPLVCEITSPSNPAADKVTKMHYYAAAGIPWYLIVDQPSDEMHLHQLSGAHYIHHSVTARGEKLHLPPPIDADVDTAGLLRN